jgi:lipopolysaccharide transport system permease protein
VSVPPPADDLAPPAACGFSRRETLSLLLALVRRDLALHHRHTRLGVLWGVLPPLLAVGVLDLFLGRIAGVARSVSGAPYPVFLYAGLLAWQFLARGIGSGAGSVVAGGWVVTQVAFPRVVLPVSHVATGALDFALGSLGLLLWTAVAGPAPGPHLLLWPVAVAALVLLSLALAVVLSAAAVFVRDVLPAVPYAVQVLFVASPVLYPLSAAEDRVPRALLLANPATGVLETFRAAWLGTPVDLAALLASLAISVAVLALGGAWFRRVEHRFADRL